MAFPGTRSLPLWECGLKFKLIDKPLEIHLSLPLWECGLKSIHLWTTYLRTGHSPCGSVDWNLSKEVWRAWNRVTPLVGVWIEIGKSGWYGKYPVVTPLVGVWLKYFCRSRGYNRNMSLPLWECGLKLQCGAGCCCRKTSLPLWECGLKLIQSTDSYESKLIVTPLVGVWIEINRAERLCLQIPVTPLVGVTGICKHNLDRTSVV